ATTLPCAEASRTSSPRVTSATRISRAATERSARDQRRAEGIATAAPRRTTATPAPMRRLFFETPFGFSTGLSMAEMLGIMTPAGEQAGDQRMRGRERVAANGFAVSGAACNRTDVRA